MMGEETDHSCACSLPIQMANAQGIITDEQEGLFSLGAISGAKGDGSKMLSKVTEMAAPGERDLEVLEADSEEEVRGWEGLRHQALASAGTLATGTEATGTEATGTQDGTLRCAAYGRGWSGCGRYAVPHTGEGGQGAGVG